MSYSLFADVVMNGMSSCRDEHFVCDQSVSTYIYCMYVATVLTVAHEPPKAAKEHRITCSTSGKKFSAKNNKDLVMACHIQNYSTPRKS